jgi:hypothetical protein
MDRRPIAGTTMTSPSEIRGEAMPATSHFAPAPGKLPNNASLGAISVLSVSALAGVPAFVRDAHGDKVLSRANQAALIDIEAIEDRDCFIPHITMTTCLSRMPTGSP